MSSKAKFYVVLKGRKTGIFQTWDECREQVHGFEQASYKSFSRLDDARQAFERGFFEAEPVPAVQKLFFSEDRPILKSICVDAACSVDKQIMEYRGVYLENRKVLFHRGPYTGGTNNIGEFLAIVHALAFMQKEGISMPVYTDSNTAFTWVKKKNINTKIDPGPEVKILIDRALSWLQNNTEEFTILKWNTSQWGEIPADFGRK